MKRTTIGFLVAVFTAVLLLILIADSNAGQELRISGLVSKITPSAADPCVYNGEAVLNLKCGRYDVTLASGDQDYSLYLTPTTPVLVGKGSQILPGQIVPNKHNLSVLFTDEQTPKIKSVTLDRIKLEKKQIFESVGLGLLVTLALYTLINSLIGKSSFWGMITGADNRISNSKFQMTLWFFLILFSYVTMLIQRFLAGIGGSLPDGLALSINIPESLGALIGVSAGSLLGAKAITVSKINANSIVKTTALDPSIKDLVSNDGGGIDIGDSQMLIWNIVAAAAYLLSFYPMVKYAVVFGDASLPEVDSTLLTLTGVSQVAYLGKKVLASDPKMTITSIDPAQRALIGQNFTINGNGFGNKPGKVIFGQDTEMKVQAWYDEHIIVKLEPSDTTKTIAPGKTILSVKTDAQSCQTSYEI